MTRDELTNRIKPPKFRVGRFVLSEYEAREMVARIAEGKLDCTDIVMIDERGNKITFDNEGTANKPIHRWDVGSSLVMRRYKANKKWSKNIIR